MNTRELKGQHLHEDHIQGIANMGLLTEEQLEGRFMNDEEIERTYLAFTITDTAKDSDSSGGMMIEFPYRESVWDNFIRYDDGKIAFDNWYPDEVLTKLRVKAKEILDTPKAVPYQFENIEIRRTELLERVKQYLIGRALDDTLPLDWTTLEWDGLNTNRRI